MLSRTLIVSLLSEELLWRGKGGTWTCRNFCNTDREIGTSKDSCWLRKKQILCEWAHCLSMHGKMQESGLTEIILWMCILVIWAVSGSSPSWTSSGCTEEGCGVGGWRVVSDAAPAGSTAAAFPVYWYDRRHSSSTTVKFKALILSLFFKHIFLVIWLLVNTV